MGGFSGGGGQFLNDIFPNLQAKIQQLGQGGGQQGQPPAQFPQQGGQGGQGGASYPGFQMPQYTWHRSMPQFNLGNPGGYQPAQQPNPQPYGGMLNLPGWQMQQAGGGAGTATGWKPTTTQNGGGAGGLNMSSAENIWQNGYGYHPTMGFIKLNPQDQQYGALFNAILPNYSQEELLAAYVRDTLGRGGYNSGEAAGVSGVSGDGNQGTDGGL